LDVEVERDGDCAVVQPLAHDLRVDAVPQPERRTGVPQVMEPDWGESRALEQWAKPLAQHT
jgi:hypothetical protein